MPTVTSKDGTGIAYNKAGNGPAVILIEGATGTRLSGVSAGLEPLLMSDFTVFSYDRRGRGDSGDTPPYSVVREVEDLDALIAVAGGSAGLFGISSGACLALEAAIRLGTRVSALAMYEAPYDSGEGAAEQWHMYVKHLRSLIQANDRGAAIALFMKFVGVPEPMVDSMRTSPMWSSLEALAPTLVYDADCLGKDRSVPIRRAKNVTVRSLIMDGGASVGVMPFMRASAEALTRVMPNAEHLTLEGQQHNVEPSALAPVLRNFFKA